jgi:hypothetical protein
VNEGERVKVYDPYVDPGPGEWLGNDEKKRLNLVLEYHRRDGFESPDERLHAAIHVVVEDQLSMGEVVVVETMARLRAGGLNRHEAVHAIGTVLAELLVNVMSERTAQADIAESYTDALKALTPDAWLKHGDSARG